VARIQFPVIVMSRMALEPLSIICNALLYDLHTTVLCKEYYA